MFHKTWQDPVSVFEVRNTGANTATHDCLHPTLLTCIIQPRPHIQHDNICNMLLAERTTLLSTRTFDAANTRRWYDMGMIYSQLAPRVRARACRRFFSLLEHSAAHETGGMLPTPLPTIWGRLYYGHHVDRVHARADLSLCKMEVCLPQYRHPCLPHACTLKGLSNFLMHCAASC